jgi:hypothetical protein
VPAKTKLHWRKLAPGEMHTFLSYLDAVPDKERPVYGISGDKSSLWQKMGGGTKHIIVLFFPDHVVFSTRSMVTRKELSRRERPLSDITGVNVIAGPMMSGVAFRFNDGSKLKVANLMHKEAEPLTRFMSEGLAAFDRSRLDEESLSYFFYACNIGLPLPDDLFESAA